MTPLAAGDRPTALNLNDRLPQPIRKVSTQIVNNSTTLVNDTELSWPLSANAEYCLDLYIINTSTATADFKFKFTLPAGATCVWSAIYYDPGTSAVTLGSGFTGATTAVNNGLAGPVLTAVHMSIVTSATTGSITLQWAQNVAVVTDTSVSAGSYGTLQRIS